MTVDRPSIISCLRRIRLLDGVRHVSRRQCLSTAPPAKDYRSRLRKLNDRLPRFLRSYTTPLLGAPVTHITSFLILHEVTAIVPLLGLVAAFHYGDWMPDLAADDSNGAFNEGVARFGRWLRKKGWIDDDAAVGATNVAHISSSNQTGEKASIREQRGVHLVLEFATAYAITKALLPLRIATSVWATPWFARVVVHPLTSRAGRIFGRK
ncbi:hypothetical protein ASPZODRAFT_130563 [Penicilliopsis zonata CBS 506.65]|uniref:Uncharacterized protein n=1 Tax=Penicilliopsis zonata CBS 506.65 TaxID=1073090 RepID=A0A1L9SMT8_9EURO|nr:hypothetical protein ASPZODRAFT_130563 [Penicilliopsis zonata CBS 506.65]OJJ48508.1 hypothetical protein ASPZODRAFT_130563 [Penicilliopsis zonata CBS 506.65]